MKICDYGCGQEAIYQFKNGKWCCSRTFYECTGYREKISEACKNPSKETRKKNSEATKKQWQDPNSKLNSKETRKKMRESHKGKTQSKETRKKQSESLKNPSKETRKKMRVAAIKRIEKNSGQANPNYNPEACKLIEEYGIRNKYDFQHAENGGEFYIKDLGYWIDGYDKNKNIVIEIDESHHFDLDGNLNMKDIERQQEIEKFLGCNFIRLKIN